MRCPGWSITGRERVLATSCLQPARLSVPPRIGSRPSYVFWVKRDEQDWCSGHQSGRAESVCPQATHRGHVVPADSGRRSAPFWGCCSPCFLGEASGLARRVVRGQEGADGKGGAGRGSARHGPGPARPDATGAVAGRSRWGCAGHPVGSSGDGAESQAAGHGRSNQGGTYPARGRRSLESLRWHDR